MVQSSHDVQRFMGMITYLGRFIPNLAQVSEPLRRLAKRTPFIVDEELQKAYQETKQEVARSLETLTYFRSDPAVPTAISCDASPVGLGAVLWQQDSAGEWLPVSCASCALTEVETRYSQMER